MCYKSKYVGIVLGSKGVNATGLIRSLGMKGCSVVFASTYTKIESKYVKDYIHLPNEQDKWINILIDFCTTQNVKSAIFPTDDETAFWIDDNYKYLEKYFMIPNAKGNLRKLADKLLMNEMAKNAGLNVPESVKISLKDFESEIHYPVILKPYAGYAGNKGDISICRNRMEYVSAKKELMEHGYKEVLLQQLLDDPKQEEIGLMGMVLPSGQIVIPGIIHKIRSYPTGRGSTSYAKFSPKLEEINLKIIEQFVVTTGYVGLFDIEMMKSDGKYWFIEINYRNGQYGFTSTMAGYNLPKNWLLGMACEKVDMVKNVNEIFYINERDDYLHVKHGEISRKEWIKQFRSATAYGMFCPGDQRPFVRQYVKIPDRIIMKWNHWKKLLKDLLIKEEWNVAIRKKGEHFLWENEEEHKVFNVLPNTIRYWAADPFIISEKNKNYLFFEMFDRFLGKGLIGYREISNGKIGKMKVAYQEKHHLSFPFVFKYKDTFYMMPEYSEGKKLPLLKAVHFPDKWENVCNWLDGKRVVDSVLLKYKEQTYLFTQEIKKGYSSDSLDLYIKQGDDWKKHESSPIVQKSANARLGGKVFVVGDEIIRVAQDCEKEYGWQLHFNNIIELSEKDYREKMMKTVEVNQIKVSTKEKFCGIHTYNSNEEYEVIDLKNNSTVKFGNFVNIMYRIICKLKR